LALLAALAGSAVGALVAQVWAPLRAAAYLVGGIGMGRSGAAAPEFAHERRRLARWANARARARREAAAERRYRGRWPMA
jgi:hypothetical protein